MSDDIRLRLEREILGTILDYGSEAFAAIRKIVSIEAFATEAHTAIFEACERLFARGDAITIAAAVEEMKARQTLSLLKTAGGIAYVASVVEHAIGPNCGKAAAQWLATNHRDPYYAVEKRL